MRRPTYLGTLSTLALVAASAAALAHDFWLEPSRFRPASGTTIDVRLFVGEAFSGRAYSRNPRHVKRFVMNGPDGEVRIRGRTGSDPAGRVKVGGEGTYVLGYRSTQTRLEVPADKFTAYLVHEGLDHVIAARRKAGTSDDPGREAFSRCAKSVLRVGKTGTDHAKGPLGLKLEIVPESDPYTLAPGDELTVRLLLDGAPLARSLVSAHHTPGSTEVVQARTDERGRVTLKLDRAGPWLLNTVHMAKAPKGVEVEWESLWSSLTFDLPPQSPGKQSPGKQLPAKK